MRLQRAVLLLAPILVFAGCASGSGGGVTGPATAPADLALAPVVSGLDHPVLVTAPPGDPRLFIVEKTGRIRVVKNGALLGTPFLDVSSMISNAFEQGLLGLAFDPNYRTNHRFFITLSNPSQDEELWRFEASANPDVASPAGTLLLQIAHPTIEHYGGMMEFGQDGMMYLSLGDGGVDKDTPGNGQSTTDLLGDVVRLDVRTGAIVIPPDNPFMPPARRELWSIGLRNPWRFSLDRQTGDMYIGDVGEDTWEEIDVAPASTGHGRGVNFGWNITEGDHCFNPASGCVTTGLTLPQLEYQHGADGCCVIGGYVYRGASMQGLRGTYFYSDYCAHWVKSFNYVNGVLTNQRTWAGLDPGEHVLSFGEDAAGELYICTEGGSVWRIVPATAAVAATVPATPRH